MIQITCDLEKPGLDRSLRKIPYLAEPFDLGDDGYRDLVRGVQLVWCDRDTEVWIDIDGERANDADTLAIARDIYRQLEADGRAFTMTDVNTDEPYIF